VVPEEKDIHSDYNGYQSEHVKHDGGAISHGFIVRSLRCAVPGDLRVLCCDLWLAHRLGGRSAMSPSAT
jgi:hypothetical protein